MAPLITPIKPKGIADQVFEQLRELIRSGKLKPGDRLLSERELSAAMGVSRVTLKNAMSRLVAMGMVEQRQGKGTFVRGVLDVGEEASGPMMDFAGESAAHLLELRAGLECHAVSLAVRRAGPGEIDDLKRSFDAMDGRVDHDVAFHMTIARATRNPAQVRVLKNLYEHLFYGSKEKIYLLDEQPARLGEVRQLHAGIIRAFEERDPELARHLMVRHGGLYAKAGKMPPDNCG